MTAPLAQTSGALHRHRTCASTLLLVRPFAPCWRLLRPRLTSRLRLAPPPFQARSEISPGKNAILPRTTAGSTPLPLGHKSFAVVCLLALVNVASYPVLVHRLTVSLCTSFPRSVTLTARAASAGTTRSAPGQGQLDRCWPRWAASPTSSPCSARTPRREPHHPHAQHRRGADLRAAVAGDGHRRGAARPGGSGGFDSRSSGRCS